jgi:hypothetical protein
VPLKGAIIQALTEFADHLPYNGVINSDPKVWKEFSTSLAKVTKFEAT